MRALLLVLVLASVGFADELVLRDGRRIDWKSIESAGDAYAIETVDGKKMTVPKADVERISVPREAPAAPLTGAAFVMSKPTITNLLPKALVDGSSWKSAGPLLVAQATWPTRAIVPVDLEVPAEYDLSLVVERVGAGDKDFAVGIVADGAACALHLDAWDGTKSVLALFGGQEVDVYTGRVFQSGKPRTLKLQIRKDALMVLLDGKEFWKGRLDWKQATTHPAITLKEKGRLFLVAAGGSWKVSAFTMAAAK